MNDEQFELLVEKGMEAIPGRFLARLENVAIVIADAPTKEQLAKNRIPQGDTLLGLYEGVPLTERGENYGMVLPDKITLFKRPIIEQAGEDGVAVEKVVRDTLWHEIAHYFGYDEEEIDKREEEGKNFST